MRVQRLRGIAEGASGRNGGFALRGDAARYDVARETYGADAAKELWQRTEGALDRLEAVAGDAFHRTGSLRLAADDEERDEIRLEFEALRPEVTHRWAGIFGLTQDLLPLVGRVPDTTASGWPRATRATATFSA